MPPPVFYVWSTVVFARRLLSSRLHRDQRQVMSEYEGGRSRLLEEFRASNWSIDEYALRLAATGDTVRALYYMHGRLTSNRATVLSLMMGALERAISRYQPETVIEVGSGTGRALLWLLHRNPGMSGLGLELTPSGVQLSKEAARRFGVGAEFRQHDALGSWDDVPRADVVYSMAALEQMPGAASRVIDRMQGKAKKAVVMFEPFPDFWTGLQSIASGLRVRQLDRLRAGALDDRFVTDSRPLPYGTALNRSAEVHLLGTG